MTSLLLSTNPGTGSVRLTITPTADITRVRRSDANGIYDVRTETGTLPHLAAEGVLVLDDYEAGHGQATYTVYDAAGAVSGSIVLALDSAWLGTPEAPQFSAPVARVWEYSAGSGTKSTVHEPDGRGMPLVIVLGTTSRRGTLTVEAGDFPAALNLLRICQRGQTMLLRQTDHPGMDMYFLPMNADIVASLTAGKASEFDLTVQYIEVARPTGALSGALGWTWDELAAAFPTWDDVTEAYGSWGDLRVDVRKP